MYSYLNLLHSFRPVRVYFVEFDEWIKTIKKNNLELKKTLCYSFYNFLKQEPINHNDFPNNIEMFFEIIHTELKIEGVSRMSTLFLGKYILFCPVCKNEEVKCLWKQKQQCSTCKTQCIIKNLILPCFLYLQGSHKNELMIEELSTLKNIDYKIIKKDGFHNIYRKKGLCHSFFLYH